MNFVATLYLVKRLLLFPRVDRCFSAPRRIIRAWQVTLQWRIRPRVCSYHRCHLTEPHFNRPNYTSAHGSGRRYYILPMKFLSFFFSFFSFAAGSPRWLYRQGTFLAQMVGYRCNFKNWVENLGGWPPIKIWGPQTPQCWKPKSEYAVQTYCGNRPWERVSKTGFKIFGAPPKNLRGVKV